MSRPTFLGGCDRHIAYSPIPIQDEVDWPPQLARVYKATVASKSNMHANIGNATCSSITVPSYV